MQKRTMMISVKFIFVFSAVISIATAAVSTTTTTAEREPQELSPSFLRGVVAPPRQLEECVGKKCKKPWHCCAGTECIDRTCVATGTSSPTAGPTPGPTPSPTTPNPTAGPTSSPTTPSPTAGPTSSPTTPSPTAGPTPIPATPSPTSGGPSGGTGGVYETLTVQNGGLPAYNVEAASGNPLKGMLTSPNWASYAYQKTDIATSLDFYYIGLNTVMTGWNYFDWSSIDGYLSQSASQNRHAILRFMLDYPRKETYVPQFLIDGGLQFNNYTEHGGGESPDYYDANLQLALQQFITAFGNRYDGDPRLGFVQTGLLGFWGEWHTYPHNEWLPNSLKDSVVQWFDAAFDMTPLQTRYSYPAANAAGFGLHDDSYAYSTLSDTINWYFWPKVQAAGYTEFWKTAVMGGELRPELQGFCFSPNYPDGSDTQQDFDECTDTTHATYMLNHYAFATGYTEETGLARAIASNHRLGYQYAISSASAIAIAGDGSVVDLEISIEQQGVAPFYYPLALRVVCDGQAWQVSGVESVLPGITQVFTFSSLPSTSQCLSSVEVSLASPHTYSANPVKFAQGAGTTVSLSFGQPP